MSPEGPLNLLHRYMPLEIMHRQEKQISQKKRDTLIIDEQLKAAMEAHPWSRTSRLGFESIRGFAE
jgi:hypothetical protein